MYVAGVSSPERKPGLFCGKTEVPSQQKPPLGLAGSIQRNGESSTSGTSSTVAVAVARLSTALARLWDCTPVLDRVYPHSLFPLRAAR